MSYNEKLESCNACGGLGSAIAGGTCGLCGTTGEVTAFQNQEYHRFKYGEAKITTAGKECFTTPATDAQALANEKVKALVEALTFYSCEDDCNDCDPSDRDRVSCGWTARAALSALEVK